MMAEQFARWLRDTENHVRKTTSVARGAALRYRRLLIGIGAVIFVAGLGLSLRALEFRAADLHYLPLAANLLLVAPLALALNAWGFQLSGKVVGIAIKPRTAVVTTSVSTLAELLPVPAGFIARSAILVDCGASVRDTATVLSVGAALWIGLAALAGAPALLQSSGYAAALLAAAGAASTWFSLRWLLSRAAPRHVAVILFHRLISLVVVALRIGVGFAMLGGAISVANAALLACANILVGVASVLPSGLGVGEALSALTAAAVRVSPATAFAAVALNRIIALLVAAACALWLAPHGRPGQ